MTTKALAHDVLEDTIAHWQRMIANPLNEPIGVTACALCREYLCRECPVGIRAGGGGCSTTPYFAFHKARSVALASAFQPDEETMKCLSSLADDELQFLISLRKDTPPPCP